MSGKRYTKEFKDEAIKQVIERGYTVREVAKRLDDSAHSLYKWVRAVRGNSNGKQTGELEAMRTENTRLKSELRRAEFSIVSLCRVLRVNRAGFYAWLVRPLSDRAMEDQKLLTKIRQFWQESGGIYGSRKIHRDLKELGITIGEKRVARIMRAHRIRSLRGYKQPRFKSGKPSVTAPNRLHQQFTTMAADQVWVTDITYIRTHEGWLYLAAVMGLYSRRVVGWSMQATLARELVLDALLMAVWRRRSKSEVILHSDQGVQFGSDDFVRFCRDHQLKPNMSRRGNCYDNAVAESFFSNLKKERIRKKIYPTRNDARSDVFDYIEIFYNQKRCHGHLNLVSPAAFEAAYTGRS